MCSSFPDQSTPLAERRSRGKEQTQSSTKFSGLLSTTWLLVRAISRTAAWRTVVPRCAVQVAQGGCRVCYQGNVFDSDGEVTGVSQDEMWVRGSKTGGRQGLYDQHTQSSTERRKDRRS